MTLTFIKWDSKLELGIKQIDQHHHRLVELLDNTYDAIMLNKSQTELDVIIKELSEYAMYHFATEKYLMTEYGFPSINSHLLEHEKFSNHIRDFQERCSRAEFLVAIDVLSFLWNWLVNHIMKVDRAYADYLIARGVT